MKTKGILLGVIIALLVGGVIFFGYEYFKPKPDSGMSNLESILLKRELHLVEYKYNNHFFVYNRPSSNSKLALIIKLPVKVSSYVDLKELKMDTVGKRIKLPYPKIDDVHIDINNKDEREIMRIRDGFLVKIKKSKSKLFESFFETIDKKSKELEKDAIKKGILEQAKDEATSFITDLLIYFDKQQQYKVEFLDSLPNGVVKDSSFQVIAQPTVDLNSEIKINEIKSEIEKLENNGLNWNYIEVDEDVIQNLLLELDKETEEQ